MVRWDRYKVYFVTLTFHRYAHPEKNRRAFMQYLRREGLSTIWKRELQKRLMQHFHLILLVPLGKGLNEEGLREAWHRIAAHGSLRHKDYGIDIQEVENEKQIRVYISKYVGKEVEMAGWEGRAWGVVGEIDVSSIDECYLKRSEYYVFRRLVRRLRKSWARKRNRKYLKEGLAEIFGSSLYCDYRTGLGLVFASIGERRGITEGVSGGLPRGRPFWGQGSAIPSPRLCDNDAGVVGISLKRSA